MFPTRYGLLAVAAAWAAFMTGLFAPPLGWVFWPWGLPYSMLAHAAANAAHLFLQRLVF